LLFELPRFEYVEPRTVGEALSILAEYGTRAKILGGGTDLLGLMKDRISGPKMPIPEVLVDVKRISEIRAIEHLQDRSVVGSGVTLTEISSNGELASRFPSFVQAAGSVATKQIRNMGTLGGNLCQRPWCWYFRHPAFECFKKGGRQCYAITGDNSTYFSVYNIGTCVMSHPSDTAPALISLGASVRIASAKNGVREVPLVDFFLGPKSVQENILQPEELLLHASIPLDRGGRGRARSVYLKERIRENWDFALASVAASGSLDSDGRIDSVRVVLGGVAPLPFPLDLSGVLLGRKLDGSTRAAVSSHLSAKAKPLKMNRYKVRIIRALVQRALEAIFTPV